MMSFLWWMGGNPSGGQQVNPLASFLPFILIIVVFYFFMIRPQKKKQQEREKMISAVSKGDKIITVGGLHGTVQGTKEKSVIVKIADNVKVEVERSAIATVIVSSGETKEAPAVEAEK